MSLLESLLLDPYPLNAWIAARTDSVKGSGTEQDPWNGSGRLEAALSITSLTAAGQEATVTTSGTHGYLEGEVVTIAGVTDTGAQYFNGRCVIYAVTGTTFKYWLRADPGTTSAAGTKTCARTWFQLDEVIKTLGPNTAIHLGPGVFETRGYYEGQNPNDGWFPRSGQKVIGSGIGVTVLKLMCASLAGYKYGVMGSAYTPYYLDAFEARDFTVDCNLEGQAIQGHVYPPIVAAALLLSGKHLRFRRIRAINFGSLSSSLECFVFGSAGAHPDTGQDHVDCVIEDCIVEQPALNQSGLITCMIMANTENAAGITGYHRACVLRNNLIDCEYRENPVAIAGITLAGTVATVQTRGPHGRVNNDWVRISGALVNGSDANGCNGSAQITFDPAYPDRFTYVPWPTPTGNPAGDMWVGRYSSHPVAITAVSWDDADPNEWLVTITTAKPHYRVAGDLVVINRILVGGSVSNSFNGGYAVDLIYGPTQLQYKVNPGLSQQPPDASQPEAFIGVFFQGLTADGGTGAVVEGNRVFNCQIGGPYHDTYSSRELIIRNNLYRSVLFGPRQVMGANSRLKLGSSLVRNGSVAIFTTAGNHLLSPGAGITIDGAVVNSSYANPYNGSFTVASVLSPTSFTYVMPADPGANAGGSPVFTTAQDISSLVRDTSNHTLAIATTPSPHGLSAGQFVSVMGATVGGTIATPYNGAFLVLPTPTSTTFRYKMLGDPGFDAAGAPRCALAVGSSVITNGQEATFTTAVAHGLQPGETVRVDGANAPYNGFFVVKTVPTSTSFTYDVTASPPVNGAPPGAFAALWQTGMLVIEDNRIELLPGINYYATHVGIELAKYQGDDIGSRFLFRRVIIRDNVIRHLDNLPDSPQATVSLGVVLHYCEEALVENNVIDLGTSTPLRQYQCGEVRYFNNTRSDGTLLQGVETDPNGAVIRSFDELSTKIEDASVLALL